VNFQFSPKNLTVAVGDTVTWVNQDFTQHDTVSGTNRIPTGIWASTLLNIGGSFSFTFNVPPGGYGYYCTPHVFTFNMVGSITVVAPNQPPSVSITSPAEGTTFNAGANIVVTANASDVDGSVARVDFFANGSPVGSSSTAPYSATINNPPLGSYTLTAVAVDNLGAGTTSSPVHVTVQGGNSPPTIAITNLVDGQTVFAGTNLVIEATASDADGAVSQVQFFTNAVLAGIATAPPYQVTLNNLAVGTYVLTAVATDNLGATGSTPPINLTVATPTFQPVFLTPPTNQSVVVGSDVTFFASASGTPPPSYQWLFNGTPIAGATLQTLSLLNVQTNNAGIYSIVASNSVGSTTSSDAMLFVLPPPNIPPTVSILSPTNGSIFAVGQSVLLSASATDTDGTVVKVDFLQSNLVASVIGSLTNPPFSLVTTDLTVGTYSVLARATDDQGASSDSETIRFHVLNEPLLTTTPPGSSIALGTAISLSIETDTNGPAILSTAFFVNSELLNGSIWQPATAGDYLLTAVVSYSGGSITSAPVGIRIYCTDTTRPTVTITDGPANFSQVTNALLLLEGTANDDCRVDYVEVQVNGGIPARLTNASDWSFATNLPPGLNVIRVRSVDFATNASFDATRFVTYLVTTGLVVKADAGGKVTPNLNPMKLRQGNFYTVTARPNRGFLFSGWEAPGIQQTNSPRLTFQLTSGMTNLIAHFRASPFPVRAGIYSGLFINTNSETAPIETSGGFDLAVTTSGQFTGRLRMNGASYPFHAAFDLSGHVLLPVIRPGLTPVVLKMDIELVAPTNFIVGFATNLVGSVHVASSLSAVFTPSTNNQAATGGHRFDLVQEESANRNVIVQALAGVTRSSSASVLGVVEGTKFTLATRVSAEGLSPFYLSVTNGEEAVAGWLHFTPFGGADGHAFWLQPGTNSVSILDVLPPTQ
jgi:hypothetical protein